MRPNIVKTFIIAEAGVNHNGSIKLAKQLIDAAIAVGADAIKFQSFQTENLVSAFAPKADYQKVSDLDETQFEMLKSLELSYDEQIHLQAYCKKQNILFLSSPFDINSVNFLHEIIDVPLIKIPSGEITNFPLLLKIAHTHKPVILSTGMSTLGDIEAALSLLAFGYLSKSDLLPSYDEIFFSASGQQILQEKVSLLHCTSEYPAPYDEVNLRALQTLNQAFGLPVGYSDHTLGISVAIAAVASGATIIEKHLTLDKHLAGPDHKASLTPDEFSAMITAIRQIELAMGSPKKIPSAGEIQIRAIARKSLVALKDIDKGELFTNENMGCKRPGTGISPTQFYTYKNKRAEDDYAKDEFIGI